MKRDGATATVILLPGGAGGFGTPVDGKPTGNNFLVRSRDFFADAGLNVAVMSRVTFAVVVTPFEFEGMRNDRAEVAVGLLKYEVDHVLSISNTEWAERHDPELPLIDVLKCLDAHIAQFVGRLIDSFRI